MKEIHFEDKIYQVSFAAMPDTLKERLSEEELKQYLSLLEQVQIKPRAIYKEIKTFCKEYPDVPEVINLLTFAHIQNHRIVEAEQLIEQTFLKYPEYLFARINYADQCIRKKKLAKVPEIFPTLDLEKLYPGKTTYHTSEFRGFLIMATYYQMALKNRELALHYFAAVKNLEPDNPSVIYLEKKLFNQSLLSRFLQRVKVKS